jgi:ComF family protein
MPGIIAHRPAKSRFSRLAVMVRAAAARVAARLPSVCPLCGNGAHGGHLCPGCLDFLQQREAALSRCARCAARCPPEAEPACADGLLGAARRPLLCYDCRAAPPGFDAAFVAFDYVRPADMLIRRLKEHPRHGLAPMLAALLDIVLHEAGVQWPADSLVLPIPSGRRSMRRRGFNPAGELARALARRRGLAMRTDILRRTRETPKQSTLSRHARQMAVVDLFHAQGPLGAREILLVDDVMTTGSTLHAAARALRLAGASRITAVAVARTP